MDRPVAFSHSKSLLAADAEAHHGFAIGRALGAARGDVVGGDLERRGLALADMATEQERERGFGVLETPTAVLELLQLVERGGGGGIVAVKVDAEGLRLEDDVTAAGLVADEHGALIADDGRIDMLVGGGELPDGVHVRAAFVGEGRSTDPRATRIGGEVGDAVDETGKASEALERSRGDALPAELQLGTRDDRGEVAIAGALADAVDRALDVGGAGFERSKGVGEAEAGVVVRMDADRGLLERGEGGAGSRGDFGRQGAAVGVAKDDAVGAAGDGGEHGRDGIGRVFLPAVDRMFAIVDDFAAMRLKEGDRVADHLEVLLGRAAEDFADMKGGGLAVDCDDRGIDLEETAHLGVFRGAHALAAGRPEGRQLGMLEFDFLSAGEELDVTGIGARPAAFDVGHAEAFELGGDAQLVIDGEMNALPLRAVAEGGIIDFDGACHGGVGGKEV